MKIAKPLLLVSTPLGIITGLIEAYRLVGGLAIKILIVLVLAGISPHGVG